MFNVKFKDRMDVERLTSVPVLGEIAKNDTGDQFVVKAKSTAPIVELFRLVRNSLQFMLNEPDKKVINVTSTVTQEGKTFFSMNLAIVLSGEVGSSNSIFTSPTFKKAVLTFWSSTVSML